MGRTKRSRRRRRRTVICDSFNVNTQECDNSDKCVRDLLKWMKAAGSGWETILKLRHFDVGNGNIVRGLMAKKAIGKSEPVIRVPLNLIMCKRVALARVVRAFPQVLESMLSCLNTHLLLAIFIIVENRLKEKSTWKHYLRTLPSHFDVPCFCNEQEVGLLPDYLKEQVEDQRRLVLTRHRQALRLFGSNFCPFDEFAWAWFVVNTRAVYYNPERSSSRADRLALVPYLDMLNHSYRASVEVGLTEDGKHYEIRNLYATYKRYDQVYINYGCHSNTFLFVEYGFFVAENPHDFIPISLNELVQHAAAAKKDGLRNEVEAASFLSSKGFSEGLQVGADGNVTWITGLCVYVLMNFRSVKGAEKMLEMLYACQDIPSEHPVIAETFVLLINEKLRQVKRFRDECENFDSDLSGILRIADRLVATHVEILLRSLSRYRHYR